ncbi:MAG: radical SAM protein [Candidatus Lernaella stagnicola]|nr:radical SAM protein [Candidatus Lernaella stagnicola]
MNRRWDRLRKHARYITRFPGVMPRAAGNYARLLLGQKRLRGIEFALTYACSGHCAHCSTTKLRQPGHERLSTAQMCDVVRQCRDLGALNINLTGGECLHLPELPEVIAACGPKSMVVSVATNGEPLSPERCDDIARWGVSIVTISLDSADPPTHDAGRGIPDLFDRIMQGTDLLRERGVDVFWCTILTRENIANGDAEAMWRLAMAKNVMLTANMPCPVGGWQKQDVLLNEAERAFHRDLITRPNMRWEGSSNYFRMGCPAGIEKLYISPYGDVMPCNFMHVSYGNLRERPLAAIWRDVLDRSPFNHIHEGCIVAEDGEILREVVEPLEDFATHPVPAAEHPRRDLILRDEDD